jgi:hypothetical protein
MTPRAMGSLASLAFMAVAGCSGGSSGGGAVPQPPAITTQSIASGRLTAPASNGSTMTLNFTGPIPSDETATVTTDVPAEVIALESGHTIGAGATVTIGPQAVAVVLDRCSGGFAGGPEITLSNNPNIVFYDASVSPPVRVASVAPITLHQVVICSFGTTPPTQTLLPARRYVVVLEV